MQIVIRQTFPLGRFHATPWKAYSHDDPHGEWPPSPWRLIRALLARAYQYERENASYGPEQREELVRAFCSSQVSWALPEFSWRGPDLFQYQPADFEYLPDGKKNNRMRSYNTTKAKDSFWVTEYAPSTPNDNAVWWFLDGEHWTDGIRHLLGECLLRMTYFGRAESLTDMRLLSDGDEAIPKPNCCLSERRGPGMVPVLGPNHDATLGQVQTAADDDGAAGTTLPPGARWLYALRPSRPPAASPPRRIVARAPVQLVQFAVGLRVSPSLKDVARLAERFRGRVLKAFLKAASSGSVTNWQSAPFELRSRAMLLLGKDSAGKALRGHRHTVFFVHTEEGKITRLGAWRSIPFDDAEQNALLSAAEWPLPLGYRDDPWTITLIPLDRDVSPPPSFSIEAHSRWKSLTPFVPPRHVFDRRGRLKAGDSVEEQILGQLKDRGLSGIKGISAQQAGWMSVHRPARERKEQNGGTKIGYDVTLAFETPVLGPVFLGHSCHFGLGLFVPDKEPE